MLKKTLSSLKAKVGIQERFGQQDHLERYTRKHSLEIHGIPEKLYKSTDDVIIKLGERLDVPIAKEEIDISHKLYNGKNHPKSTVVKFINYWKKAQLYRKQTELKSFCLRDRGRLRNEGRPILLKIGTQSRHVDLCSMPKFQVQRLFLAEFWISAHQGSPGADFQCNLATFQSLF